MDRMRIRDILREADKCYIPDIPLRRGVPCRRIATRVTRVMHTQSQIHTLDTKIRRACVREAHKVRRENTDPAMWDCHHSWLTVPDGAEVRRARWVAEGGGRGTCGGWTEGRITNVACHMVKQRRFTTDRVPHRQHGVGASECQVWGWDQPPPLVCAPFLACVARCDWPRAVWRRACVLFFIVCSFNVFLLARTDTLLNLQTWRKHMQDMTGRRGGGTGQVQEWKQEGNRRGEEGRRQRGAKLASNNTPMQTDGKQDTLLK